MDPRVKRIGVPVGDAGRAVEGRNPWVVREATGTELGWKGY